MPTYAYACTACDHAFDAVQSFSDDPLSVCPECDGRLRKVYGSIGVTFKGSGFYRTDSRAASSKSSTVPASSGGSGSGSSGSGSSGSGNGSSSSGSGSGSSGSSSGS
ncbi:MAG TPA: zinc ribbon domain-containing protein, partial [Dermatophilaceae bacterium]|nr:zinc ribbon domain-containing protein [Dermatophilaceae bacterium]HOA02724.1 zinc ribbon domain-containing protein [Dermatophilaceae bacterium]HPZ68756.1 zinc ribbon domain-containing protein [Dermatophilaceae bacterium]HQD01901.1 zinc ribbon domain-containing protein [Dermatophilaceae bacterium]HRC66159.1 zinc ribbon domain-containing protein [Dermatophilaceae bacterium]